MFLLPIWFVLFGLEIVELKKKKQFQLECLFQDFLVGLSTSVRAGYSLENAFENAMKELILLHGAGNLLVQEMKRVSRARREGARLEAMLVDAGINLECEDMRELGEVLHIATRVGGSLSKTIGETTKVLHERHTLRQEIEDLLAGRKLEAKIMECIPFCLTMYVEIGTPNYFEPLFGNIYGVVMMSLCLMAYLVAKVWMHAIIGRVVEG